MQVRFGLATPEFRVVPSEVSGWLACNAGVPPSRRGLQVQAWGRARRDMRITHPMQRARFSVPVECYPLWQTRYILPFPWDKTDIQVCPRG